MQPPTPPPPPVYHGALTASRQGVDYPPVVIIRSSDTQPSRVNRGSSGEALLHAILTNCHVRREAAKRWESSEGIRVGNTLMTHIHAAFLSRASGVVGTKRLRWLSQFLMFCHRARAAFRNP